MTNNIAEFKTNCKKMKLMILILVLICITTYSHAQQVKETYSDYTACSECFDQWQNTGFENYTYLTHSQKAREAKLQTRKYVGGIVSVFTTAVSLIIYTLIYKTTNDLH